MTIETKPIALTGDRPTGPLHLGHLAGSLLTRLPMQESHRLHVMIADTQALTDNASNPGRIRANILEVMSDYLAVGLDPMRCNIFLQSAVPALTRLTMIYLNLVSVSRLERNPTVRAEIAQKDMERSIPAGFLAYPVAQAADITAFMANDIPVGEDQLPMIEISNEIVRRVNRIAGNDILVEARALLSRVGRLPGIDGQAKASKSLGNAIPIGAAREDLQQAVMRMYTDPGHVRVSDPGQVEGNVVFAYLDAFNPDREEVEALKEHYRRGGLGDVTLKRRLVDVLNDLLAPMRDRRAEIAARPQDMLDMLATGSAVAVRIAEETTRKVEDAFGILRLK